MYSLRKLNNTNRKNPPNIFFYYGKKVHENQKILNIIIWNKWRDTWMMISIDADHHNIISYYDDRILRVKPKNLFSSLMPNIMCKKKYNWFERDVSVRGGTSSNVKIPRRESTWSVQIPYKITTFLKYSGRLIN